MKYQAANTLEDFSVRSPAESGQQENIQLSESHPPTGHFKKNSRDFVTRCFF
jgi:hypothetical protein